MAIKSPIGKATKVGVNFWCFLLLPLRHRALSGHRLLENLLGAAKAFLYGSLLTVSFKCVGLQQIGGGEQAWVAGSGSRQSGSEGRWVQEKNALSELRLSFGWPLIID